MKERKKMISELQFGLTLAFVVCLLVANIITAKQIQLPFGIVMTSAIIVFPITYILSDVFSEVYGYRWSRLTCYMGFVANLFMVIIFSISISTPAPSYWENQEAYQTVLGSTPRILVASLTAFVVGDLVNDRIFRKMKAKHPKDLKGFHARAILSSVGGNITDSAIFIPLAFIGQMPIQTMIVMLFTQAGLKTLYETIMLPITGMVVKKVAEVEGTYKYPNE